MKCSRSRQLCWNDQFIYFKSRTAKTRRNAVLKWKRETFCILRQWVHTITHVIRNAFRILYYLDHGKINFFFLYYSLFLCYLLALFHLPTGSWLYNIIVFFVGNFEWIILFNDRMTHTLRKGGWTREKSIETATMQ